MPLPVVDLLPDPPTITDPANFEDRAEEFLISLVQFVVQLNSVVAAIPGAAEMVAQEAAQLAAAIFDVTAFAEAGLGNVSQADARQKVGTGTMAYRNVTISTANPSGGADGDVWFKVD